MSISSTNEDAENREARQDFSLSFTSIFPYLSKASFERKVQFHPRKPEPRRSSTVPFQLENGNTLPLSLGHMNNSPLLTQFLETSIELAVHRIIADVLMDLVEEEILGAMRAYDKVREDFEEVRGEILGVGERRREPIKTRRRTTVDVVVSSSSKDAQEVPSPSRKVARRHTTDAVPRPAAKRNVTFASLLVAKEAPGAEEESEAENLDDLIRDEEALKDLKRELNAEKTELRAQIERLSYQAQGPSGVMETSFQGMHAKMKQRQKEIWVEMVEEAVEGEGKILLDRS